MFTLSEAYEAVNGHDEFVVKTYDGLVSFDYILVFPGSFEAKEEEIRDRAYFLWEKAGGPISDSAHFWLQAEKDCNRFAHLRRNFRGVTFNAVTGELLSLPLHKFFNVNQVAETQFDLIKHHTATIYEKLDGSMIHFFMHPEHGGYLTAATCRSTQTPQAQMALRLVNMNDNFVAGEPSLKDMILESIQNGYTPIFEFVALQNQIVVRYPEPRVVYLISRNRTTGEYLFEDKYPDKAQRYQFNFGEVFLNLDKEEFEGYVCHLPNMIVKAKTNWYMERHRAVDALMKPAYKLYQIVFDGVMDDLIAMATEPYKPALQKIYNEAQRDLLDKKREVELQLEELQKIINEAKEKGEFNFPSSPVELLDLIREVDGLKSNNQRVDAIKRVRDFTGLGLAEAKTYVEKGVWPHGFIQRDEAAEELKRNSRIKSYFAELVRQKYPENFSLLVAMFQGKDPSSEIKDRLMEGYRIKYPNKLYANLEDDT